MGVRLLAALDRRNRVVDGVLVGVGLAQLLLDEVLNQLAALVGVQLAGQGDLDFAVSAAALALVLVTRLPELARVVLGPARHVAVAAGFQILVALAGLVLTFARDVVGMAAGLAFCTNTHAKVIRRHRGTSQAGRDAPARSRQRRRSSAAGRTVSREARNV